MLFLTAVISLFIGFTIGFILGNLSNRKEEDDTIIVNSPSIPDANEANEIANAELQKHKDKIIEDLFKEINTLINRGEFRWHGFDHSTTAKNIKDEFTREELISIFEPKGYKVSFMPTGVEAEILFISWEKENSNG